MIKYQSNLTVYHAFLSTGLAPIHYQYKHFVSENASNDKQFFEANSVQTRLPIHLVTNEATVFRSAFSFKVIIIHVVMVSIQPISYRL